MAKETPISVVLSSSGIIASVSSLLSPVESNIPKVITFFRALKSGEFESNTYEFIVLILSGEGPDFVHRRYYSSRLIYEAIFDRTDRETLEQYRTRV